MLLVGSLCQLTFYQAFHWKVKVAIYNLFICKCWVWSRSIWHSSTFMVMLPFKSIQLTQIFGMHKVNWIPRCNSVSEQSLPHNLGHGTQQHQIRRNNANLHTRTLTRTLTHTHSHTHTHKRTKNRIETFSGEISSLCIPGKNSTESDLCCQSHGSFTKAVQLRYNTAVKSLPAPVQGFTATVQWFTTQVQWHCISKIFYRGSGIVHYSASLESSMALLQYDPSLLE